MCASNDFGCLLIWTSSDVVVNRLRFKWFGCQLIWDSSDLVVNRCVLQMILVVCWFELQVMWLSIDWDSSDSVVNWFEIQVIWLSIDLRFNWFGCQLIWDSNDLVVNRCVLQMILVVCWFELQVMWLSIDWDSSDSVVNWFEIQVIWLSIDLRFNWFGCQLIWDSNDLVVNRCVLQMILVVCWFELQVMWLSIDLRFKWFGCQLIWDSSDLVVNRFEIQMSWLSIDLRFKWFGCQMIWGWCVIQMILSNEAFLRDFLQKRSFEDPKQSNSTRLPSKMKLWRSKTKQFYETSFKIEALKLKNEAFLRDFLQNCEALKLKNEAFLRDFLQKRSFEDQKRSNSARLPSKTKLWSSKTKFLCETSFKNDMSTRHLTSEFQYVLTIFNWMLQKYCACHAKVEPRHTNSCNCHAKWSLQSNTSVTWNLQPFHGFCVGGFKHRYQKARNHCACHAKSIVSEPLQIHHACQRFCNPNELLRLPRILQRVEIPAPATRNTLSTSKNVPSPWCFNDFDFQIALARRRGANFAKLNFQKCSEHATF